MTMIVSPWLVYRGRCDDNDLGCPSGLVGSLDQLPLSASCQFFTVLCLPFNHRLDEVLEADHQQLRGATRTVTPEAGRDNHDGDKSPGTILVPTARGCPSVLAT